MRKFYAAIALCITLIGTFAPVVFSVSLLENKPKIKLQKNIASASTTVVFGKSISLKEILGKPDYYRLETTIQYDTAAFSAGTKYSGFNYFGTAAERDPHYQVINTTTGATIIDKPVTEPEKLGLQDEKYGPLRQDIQITTPGKYEAWFYEDYVTGNNLLSSKIKFEITADKKLVIGQTNQTTNVRGDDQVGFTPVTGVIAEGSTTARFSVGVTYKNETKQATEDAEENLYWFLKDESGTLINENAINLNPKPKYNTLREFAIDIPNLELGKKYTITFVEKDIVTAAGRMISSQEFPFTAGVPIDNAATQQQIQQQNANNALADLQNSSGQNGTDNNDGLECKLADFDFFCYLVKFTVYITTFVPNVIATVSGLLSDFFLKFAMDPKMYGLSYTEGLGSMIYGAWSIVRDFANIGFIFALFVAAFMLILNKNQINNVQFEPKRVVVRVVIMALLVNFSLMFCRVIIQSADVFSHILYNKIVVDVKGETAISTFLKEAGVKSVSFGLVTNTNPQQLFMNQGVSKDDSGSYTEYLAIGFITFFIYLIYIYLFVSMMLLWMGRIFGAWIAMILSPIAFVSWAIPFIEDDKHIGFTNWLQNFVKLAFMVPIYLFFVYIAIEVMNLQNLTTGIINDPNAGWMFTVIVTIIKVLLPLLAATFILMKGKTIAYDMSGEIGKVAGKFTGMATSLALGAATGGSALLARQTLGRAGSAIANNNTLLNAQAKGGLTGFGAGLIRKSGTSVGAATFDVRNSENIMKRFGGVTGAAGEKIDLGTKGLQKDGGFIKEGTVGKQISGFKQSISDKVTKSQEEALADLKLNQQSELQVEVEKAEAEKQRAEENLAHEQARQNTATAGFRNDADYALESQKQTEQERVKLENESDAVYNEIQKQEQEVQKMAQDMANKQPNEITEQERRTYEDKVKNLEDSKQQQKLILKALASIDAHTQANTEVMQDMKDKGYTSIAQMERDKASLEASAKVSSEKSQLENAEKAVKEKETKIEEMQAQMKKAQKVGNTAEVTRLKNEIDKAKKELTDPDGLQEKLTKAKQEYNTKFGDKIKQLDKDLKAYEKKLKNTEYNQTKVQLLTHEVSIKSRNVAEKTFDKNQRNKDIELTYVKRIERDGASNSGFRRNVAIIANGRVGGENLNNAGRRTATATRNSWRK